MNITHGMRVLLQVVDSGSFARAAQALGLSNAAVTRQVGALEQHLGARLLHRTTRRLSLTDAGTEFCARARAVLEMIAEAESAAAEGVARPAGVLRMSAPLSFGVLRLADELPGFRTRYPQLKLDIDLSDRVVDLANEGFDVALRIAASLESSLIARRIAPIGLLACASPGYLRRRGTPRSPADLERHEVLSYKYLWSGDAWSFTDPAGNEARVRVRPAVHATNGDLLRRLSMADGGIILQPDFLVAEELRRGRLVRVLQDYRAMELSLYAVYLSHQHLPTRVRVFIDYLVERLGTTGVTTKGAGGTPRKSVPSPSPLAKRPAVRRQR
jgi:DNA-binding transcriptional LysR family regulator